MAIILHEKVNGQNVGDTYNGPAGMTAWLLAHGYARDTTTPTSHLKTTSVAPADDPLLKVNREDPGDAFQFGTGTVLAPRLETVETVDTDLSVTALPAAGGTALRIKGDNFTAATGVTFGGTAGTSFSVVDDKTILVTSPAKTAGSYNVIVTKGVGNSNTLTNGVTYV